MTSRRGMHILIGLAVLVARCHVCGAAEPANRLVTALQQAGQNAAQIERALQTVPDDQRSGMEFLVEHMPPRDLRELDADFLLENVRLAYEAWRAAPWADHISEPMFLNYVLPYASVNERRDRWRADFRKRFLPLVADLDSPGEAAGRLNLEIFKQLNVQYSRKRLKADQSPYESIESGKASCTGLTILLVDACRSVAIPARFVGIPSWTGGQGNHSWAEIWDDSWHFTGAAEPHGGALDKAWFVGQAARALRDQPEHAIYAVSYKSTPLRFPCVWAPAVDYVSAVNVTDRYVRLREQLPTGKARIYVRLLDSAGQRLAARFTIRDAAGEIVASGVTHDERFDGNDHAAALLALGGDFRVEFEGVSHYERLDVQADKQAAMLRAVRSEQVWTFREIRPVAGVVEQLEAYLAIPAPEREPLAAQDFAQTALSRADARLAADRLWQDRVGQIRHTRAAEMEAQTLQLDGVEMPFSSKVFGDEPDGGRSLFISLHGGGGAPAEVNDQQWKNQQGLYEPAEGIYLAPRAPTNTWNMWHQQHVDHLLARMIENLIVFENVDSNRVYLMGYSAGGDGVFRLAPRMADRWAAAAMMAGHPGGASPLALRNIGFAIYVGGRDERYERNKRAQQWKEELALLRAGDPGGYQHLVTIYPDKGHWMDGEDASAVPWMARFTRNPFPQRVIWKRTGASGDQFYWLAVSGDSDAPGGQATASYRGQRIEVETEDLKQIVIRLNDQMADLDRSVQIVCNGELLAERRIQRTIATLAKTLAERGDRRYMFPAEATVRWD